MRGTEARAVERQKSSRRRLPKYICEVFLCLTAYLSENLLLYSFFVECRSNRSKYHVLVVDVFQSYYTVR